MCKSSRVQVNSRPGNLGEMPDSLRLETVQTVAPVRTISWVGMEFSRALEKLVDLRVIESYCLWVCGVFHCRSEVAVWHSNVCHSASWCAGAVESTWHKYCVCNVGWEGSIRFSFCEGAWYRQLSNRTVVSSISVAKPTMKAYFLWGPWFPNYSWLA